MQEKGVSMDLGPFLQLCWGKVYLSIYCPQTNPSSPLRETALCKVRGIFQLTVAYDVTSWVSLFSAHCISWGDSLNRQGSPQSHHEVLSHSTFLSQKAATFTFFGLFWMPANCKYDFFWYFALLCTSSKAPSLPCDCLPPRADLHANFTQMT